VVPLPLDFYDRETALVAEELLGLWLVHRHAGKECIGRIIETEAYLGGEDLASHSSKGRTPRTEVMFGPPGRAYVYLIYGMYHCMNVVTEKEGTGSAVLIRAVEPIQSIEGKTHGPGLLCKAMGIDRQQNRHSLLSDTLFITQPHTGRNLSSVHRSARVGVDYAGAWAVKPLRFYEAENPWLSKGKPSTGEKRKKFA
jgi:DNA-3-methyladenine glycosylase